MNITIEDLREILELVYDEGSGGYKEQKNDIIEEIIDEIEKKGNGLIETDTAKTPAPWQIPNMPNCNPITWRNASSSHYVGTTTSSSTATSPYDNYFKNVDRTL